MMESTIEYRTSTFNHRIVAFTACLLFHPALAAGELSSYEKKHTHLAVEHSQAGSTYIVDPHVWVYTSAFAKRWGMPKKWIDDSLQGAEAIAYKVANEGYVTCGYFRDPEACIPKQNCLFDFYINKTANLPWQNEQLQGQQFFYPYRSLSFLTAKVETDSVNYNENFPYKFNQYAAVVGFDNTYYAVNLDPVKLKASNYDIAFLREFDRIKFKSMDFISVEGSCGFIGSTERGQSEFVIAEPSVIDGKPGPYFGKLNSSLPIHHRVILPDDYANRVRTHHEKHYGDHLWAAIKNNLNIQQTK